jgi:hypothetical protein
MTPVSDGAGESLSVGSCAEFLDPERRRTAGSAACAQVGTARVILDKIIPNPLGGTVFLALDPVTIQFQTRTYG